MAGFLRSGHMRKAVFNKIVECDVDKSERRSKGVNLPVGVPK